jgi:ubiquinol-cytochrome c reductase subunit 7
MQALSRLTPREEYDRAYRIRLATQLSVLHHGLPKDQVLPKEQVGAVYSSVSSSSKHCADLQSNLIYFTSRTHQDQRYLTPLIKEVEASEEERKLLDTAIINRSAH